MKPKPSSIHLSVTIRPENKDELIKQAAERGMSISQMFDYLGASFRAGSIWIIEPATYKRIIEDEIKPSLWRWVSKLVRQEVELILVENGFLTRLKKRH